MTVFYGSQRSDPQNFAPPPQDDLPHWRTLPQPRMVPVTVMYFHLAQWETHVRMERPRDPSVAVIHEAAEEFLWSGPPETFVFSRSEWAVFVLSGLKAALDSRGGWRLWDEASAHRSQDVAEKDHLLVIASLLANGRDVGQDYENINSHRRATRAIRELSCLAAAWRQQEGIRTPFTVFPDGSACLDTAPPDGVHRLPDQIFQAPLLEHAVEATHVDVLIDLAKQGEEATFKDLAQTLGVPAAKLEELWAGTVRRVR